MLDTLTKCVLAPLLAEVLRYGTSNALQMHFKCTNAIEMRDGIVPNFYLGLSHKLCIHVLHVHVHVADSKRYLKSQTYVDGCDIESSRITARSSKFHVHYVERQFSSGCENVLRKKLVLISCCCTTLH